MGTIGLNVAGMCLPISGAHTISECMAEFGSLFFNTWASSPDSRRVENKLLIWFYFVGISFSNGIVAYIMAHGAVNCGAQENQPILTWSMFIVTYGILAVRQYYGHDEWSAWDK